MIKKLILMILSIPVMGWSQPTTFSNEETEYVRNVLEKIFYNSSISTDEVFSELDYAMQKVPYHPGLVQYLLRVKLLDTKDYEFVYSYCKKLDDHYLSTFQPILVELCGYTYYYKDDYEGLYDRIIPLIKDENIKGLYLALYYRNKDDEHEFIKHAKYSILGNYKYDILNNFRDYHLDEYYRIISHKKNTSLLESFLKDYEQVIFSSNLNALFYLSLIEDATHTINDVLAIKLINYVKELDAEKYKSLAPAIAYYYSFKGEEEVALEALNKAFEIDKSEFLKSYNPDARLIFNTYSTSISRLSDFKTKEIMVEKGLHYFEDMVEYKIMFKLYQSMLYASKDIIAAKAILKECEPFLNEINYSNLNNILIINNEMGKKNPDYRMVDGLLDKVVTAIGINSFYYQKIMYRYKVNYRTKKPVFTLNEVVEDFDKIFSTPLSKEDEMYYLRSKLLFIGESDKEWFIRELEKLPTDIANKLIESYNMAENNPEKIAEILSTNQIYLNDINRTVDFINISYLNSIILK
jgi:hypothetical protein